MSSEMLLAVSDFPLVLHNYATAAADRLDAISAKATVNMVEFPYPRSGDGCKYAWNMISLGNH